MAKLAALILAAFALCAITPATAQLSPQLRAETVVAPGDALVLLRQALDQAMRIHSGAAVDEFMLSYSEGPPWPANVGVSHFPPLKMQNGKVIVSNADNRHYQANIANGRVGMLTLDDDHEPVSDGSVVEEALPYTSLLFDAEHLVQIEQAWSTLDAAYDNVPPLSDLIVSYTDNATPGLGYSSPLTYIVFTRSGRATDSYSVLINGGDVRTYRGIIHQH